MLAQPFADQAIDMQRLLNILLQLDFNSIDQQEPLIDILKRVFPKLPEAELIKIEKKTTKLLKAMNAEEDSSDFFHIKLTFTIATTVASLYFGGPLVAKGAKAVMTQIYTLIFGAPLPETFVYGLLFKPCQAAVNKLALTYGPYIAGLTAAPVTYAGMSLAEFMNGRIIHLKQWAFNNKRPLTQTPLVTSLKNVDDILGEFEELILTEEPLPIVTQHAPLAILTSYSQITQKENVFNNPPPERPNTPIKP